MDGKCASHPVGVCQRAKNALMQLPMSVRPHCGSWAFFTKCTILLITLLPTAMSSSPAGSCWLQVGRNGRCKGLLEMDITKEDCRASQRGLFLGWTPHANPTRSQLFYWDVISGGAPFCEPCRTTCEGVQCDTGKECRVRNNMPKCVCPSCNRQDRNDGNVCGMDVRTYHSECSLNRHNCRRRLNVMVDYTGKCRRSCDSVVCGDGKRCVVDQNGLPHCIYCSESCPAPRGTSRMLCGADGVTYPNSCHLYKATCDLGRSVMVSYMGSCIVSLSDRSHLLRFPLEGATCSTIACKPQEKCLTHPVTARPHCVACDMPCSTAVYGDRAICGSDGRTYGNWCALRAEACRSSVVIETRHSGLCDQEHGDEGIEPSDLSEEETSVELTVGLPNHSQVIMAALRARRH